MSTRCTRPCNSYRAQMHRAGKVESNAYDLYDKTTVRVNGFAVKGDPVAYAAWQSAAEAYREAFRNFHRVHERRCVYGCKGPFSRRRAADVWVVT